MKPETVTRLMFAASFVLALAPAIRDLMRLVRDKEAM